MASKIIGVEIGSDTVKLAVVSGGAVKTMAVERMPENLVREGKVTAPAAMSDFIKNMCREHGIRPGPCALVLPQQIVIAHKVIMPVMNEKELLLNLPFEFRDFVGKDTSKYDYDYSVLSVHDKVMELYAAAVRREVVEDYYSILRKAGLTLKVAMPVEMAWLNLIRSVDTEPDTVCIVDVGHNITRVNIFANGHYEMGKDIEMGGQLLDQTIADYLQVDPYVARTRKEANLDNVLVSAGCYDAYGALSVEVMKIVNFYRSSAENGTKLNDIYYCGGSSLIESLRTAILKRTDLTMHHIRRFVVAPDIDDDTVLRCALAAGAAMQNH